MSFFEDASLVLIPSAQKTSKVYSVKPTDGTGDLTFTRSNDTATRVGPDGLIEKVRTNLQTYSQDFSNAVWGKSAGATLTHSQTDPNGGTTASRLQMPSGTTNFFGTSFSGATNGGKYTHSVYMKSNTGSTQSVRLVDGVRGVAGGTLIASVTTSWQRFEVVITTASTNAGLQIDNQSGTYDNDILIAFAQSEVSDFGATPYIATTTAAVSVGPVANVPRLDYLNSSCPRLLLEPQRTNLVTFSEQINDASWNKNDCTISANASTSPDGYVGADKFIPNNASSGANVSKVSFAASGSTAYSYSIFLKAAGFTSVEIGLIGRSPAYNGGAFAQVNLTTGVITSTSVGGTWTSATSKIDALNDGWYRVSVSGVSPSGTIGLTPEIVSLTTGNGTDGVLVWGAQVEAGAYATSYIPTLGAAVTRGADAASKTSASALIGQTEGTIFWETEFTTMVATGHEGILNIDDGTFGDTIYLFKGSTGNFVAEIYIGGVQQASFSTSAKPIGTYKMALAYANNNTAFFLNGEQIGTTDTSCSIPATNRIQLGNGALGPSTDRTAQVLLFPTRLTNAQLAELTTL